MLQVGPLLRERDAEPAAKVDRAVFFCHPPWMEVLAGLLDRAAPSCDRLAAPLQPDQGVASKIPWSPEVVVLVGTDGGRQAVGGTEEMKSAGLPVVAGEDAGPHALFRRQRLIDPGHIRHQLWPAELVPEALVQRSLVPDLGPRRGDVETPLVGEKLLRRKKRQDRRGED